MTNFTNSPSIRFNKFTEAWEQYKVCELASDTYGGGTPSTSNDDFWKGSIPWIQSSDLSDHQVFGITPRKYISKVAVQNSATKIIPKNSIAIITRVGVGKLAIIPFSYATSQDFLSLSKLNTDIVFSAYLLYKKLQSELNSVQGTSIKGITKDELLAKVVAVPELKEQEKIASYFTSLDNLITLHQRKLEKLKNIKQSMLEKMFPKDGSLYPEVRFNQFTEAWEQHSIGDIIEEYTEITTINNQYPALTSSRKGIFLQTEYFAGHQIASKNNIGYNIVPRGYFTYRHMSDDEIFIFNINNIVDNGIVSTLYPVFKTKNDKMESFFLQYILNYGYEFRKFAILQKQGGSRTYMYLSKLKELKLTIPNDYQEQCKISSYLQSIDHLITLHQRKLEKTKNLKQSMLEKMFI